MAIEISGSVGLNGKNKQTDVRVVQELLNVVPMSLGGPDAPITVDGFCGPVTVKTITRFQNKNFGWGDGRVDPAGKTLSRLNDFADALNDPKSPLAAMKAIGGSVVPAGNPGGVDNNSFDPSSPEWAKVGSVVGTVVSALGPFNSGLMMLTGTMVWSGKNSSATFLLTKSKKTVFLPASSLMYVGKSKAMSLAGIQWTRSGATSPPAKYYQTGNGNPATKPAPYTSKGNGVSPGYFNQ